jgi:putative spermidine/putrescine transport system substrate-binding protein
MNKKCAPIASAIVISVALCLSLVSCAQKKAVAADPTKSLDEITKLAQKEGQVASVGMPDDWADWADTWKGISDAYGIKHNDTDMSSGEEIAKFLAEKDKPSADIGDVGIAFGPQAVAKGVTQPYKTSYWNEIPDWAKDPNGEWMVGYQGTIGFMVNKTLVKKIPHSWNDLLSGDYKVTVGDVTKAAQAQNAVLAAAMAFGGDEGNIEPGIAFYEKLAKQKRISLTDVSVANLEKGEIAVITLWDFNALGYRQKIDPSRFEVVIPSEGSVVSGYASIINKYAPHPYAAFLAREYIFSDAGQINLAKGFARPIRSAVKLPEDVAAKLLPPEEYKNVKPVKDFSKWEATAKTLPEIWQERILSQLQ